jgi:hypothetical protein
VEEDLELKLNLTSRREADQSGDREVDQSDDRGSDQPGDREVDQPGDRDVDQPDNREVDQSDDRGSDQPDDREVDQPDDRGSDQSGDREVDQPGDRESDQPDLEKAYAFFKRKLFKKKQFNCLIRTETKVKNPTGFSGDGYFKARNNLSVDGDEAHTISLNPNHFLRKTTREILASLVHQMVHAALWEDQNRAGERETKPTYHSKDWAMKMEKIGLIPSSTGKEGGKKTGQVMSQYEKPGGLFAKACQELFDSGFNITWADRDIMEHDIRREEYKKLAEGGYEIFLPQKQKNKGKEGIDRTIQIFGALSKKIEEVIPLMAGIEEKSSKELEQLGISQEKKNKYQREKERAFQTVSKLYKAISSDRSGHGVLSVDEDITSEIVPTGEKGEAA